MTPADEAWFQAALTRYNGGDASGAAKTLQTLAARYPKNLEAQSAAGMSLLESDQIEAGASFLERSIKLQPTDMAIRQNLAVAYMRLHRFDDAVTQMDLVSATEPSSFTAWYTRGQALASAGHPDRAAQSYERAAGLIRDESSSTIAELQMAWALALVASGQPKAALAVLERYPMADTDTAFVELRAEVYERNGEYKKAVDDFRRAAEISPTEPYLQAYGEELLRHWTFPAAASIFEYGVKMFPHSESLRRDLGIAYFGNNDFVRAGDVFGALLAEYPADDALGDLLGRSCAGLGTDSSSACSQLPAFARAHPNNAPAALYAAITLLHKPGDNTTYTQAAALLQSALRSDPKLAEAWYQMGVLQQETNDWANSAVSLEHAIELKPSFPEAHYRLSRAYYRLGRSDEAKEQMRLQQSTTAEKKEQDNRRMQEVLTFVTETH